MTDLPKRPEANKLHDYVDASVVAKGFGYFAPRRFIELVNAYVAQLPEEQRDDAVLEPNHYLLRQRVLTRGAGAGSLASDGPFIRADILQAMVEDKTLAPHQSAGISEDEHGHKTPTLSSHLRTDINKRPNEWRNYAINVKHAKENGSQER